MVTIKPAQHHGMVASGIIAAIIAVLLLARLVAELVLYCAGLCFG